MWLLITLVLFTLVLLILAVFEIGQQALTDESPDVHRWNIVFVAGNIAAFLIFMTCISLSRKYSVRRQLRKIPRACMPFKSQDVSRKTAKYIEDSLIQTQLIAHYMKPADVPWQYNEKLQALLESYSLLGVSPFQSIRSHGALGETYSRIVEKARCMHASEGEIDEGLRLASGLILLKKAQTESTSFLNKDS